MPRHMTIDDVHYEIDESITVPTWAHQFNAYNNHCYSSSELITDEVDELQQWNNLWLLQK